MTARRRILAVTGASGYIGSALCTAAINAGWDVLALSRRVPQVAGCKFVAYDLAQPVDAIALSGVTAIVHLVIAMENHFEFLDFRYDHRVNRRQSLRYTCGV